MIQRWQQYQEQHYPWRWWGVGILIVGAAAAGYGARLGAEETMPVAAGLLAAATTWLLGLQHRISLDLRSVLAIPGGLSRRELGWVGVACGCILLGLAIAAGGRFIPYLLGIWLYLAALGQHFFVRQWLSDRPLLLLLSHQAIWPLILGYGAAQAGVADMPFEGWLSLMMISLFAGCSLELAPLGQERGDRPLAVLPWLVTMWLTGFCGLMAAQAIAALVPMAIIVAVGLLMAGLVAQPQRATVALLPLTQGWLVVLSVGLGLWPWIATLG
jgi:hypothetical protein